MENSQNKTGLSSPAIPIRIFFFFLLTAALIFASAGKLEYWQGWLFYGIYLIIFLYALIIFADKKDLIQERIKPGPGVKWWDKIIFRIYLALNSIIIIISSLDSGRFHWSPKLHVFVYIVAYMVMRFSYFFILWAMWTNNFFSSRVRIQTDRGQYVVQEGPYSFVRHPGYLGVLFWQPSIPLALGSLWGLIPACLAVIIIIIRTYLEDRMLQKELPGYSDYTQKVRYCLMRGIW
jgi:protein-S-isoprenylcysteine O-methyltransferase Ste14